MPDISEYPVHLKYLLYTCSNDANVASQMNMMEELTLFCQLPELVSRGQTPLCTERRGLVAIEWLVTQEFN